MSNNANVLSLFLALGCVSCAWAQTANMEGYVTRVDSSTEFSVDGAKIAVTPETVFSMADGQGKPLPEATPVPYLGEFAKVSGTPVGKSGSVTAKQVVFYPPAKGKVRGTALIERLLDGAGGRRLVRADGRLIDVPAGDLKAVPSGAKPDKAVLSANLRVNEWIAYEGVEQTDGTVALTWAEVKDNAVKPGEAKLIAKENFDPAAVTEKDRQSKLARTFEGIDPKRIPAYKNEDEQARIDRIGASLIPGFQKALADGDPLKIDFRFQLVDEAKWRDAKTLPSGIILVPRQIVERLTDDSQLAAVLADNIACALEKQDYRAQGTRRAMTGAQVAGAVAGAFIPGAGLATDLAMYGKGKSMLAAAEAQSGRVALGLMHDAGYDLRQAPEAWWTLAAKPGHDPHDSSAPARANNQFQALGTTWRSTLQRNEFF